MTGEHGHHLGARHGLEYVEVVPALVAAPDRPPRARHILELSGGGATLVDLDARGNLAGFRANSLCAAGTGAFLDEQAERLGLDPRCPPTSTCEHPPHIASRCAVFARSDMVHRQQEGWRAPEVWSGLCRGMVESTVSTLFRGRPPRGPVLLVGGVAANPLVQRWMRDTLGVEVIVPARPEAWAARGAAALALDAAEVDWSGAPTRPARAAPPSWPPLELRRSSPPPEPRCRKVAHEHTEVRLHGPLRGEVTLGLDIGSTSTKAVALSPGGEVLADLYRRTGGDPIRAAQALLRALEGAADGPLEIRGLGTTGSGRRLVGALLGADLVLNEISAHVRAALLEHPEVDTLMEIGGQDAKFVSLVDGVPRHVSLNYLCASGTGAFVEEQARRLGFAVEEVGPAVLGVRAPRVADRCTVFMGREAAALLGRGHHRDEVMAAVLRAVARNYLDRVVQQRPLSRERVAFMGATARNIGLVAAFEALLGVPVDVSPWCHVMGALGVALRVHDERAGAGVPTRFRGLSTARARVELERSECGRCLNRCTLTSARLDGVEGPSWGAACGRDTRDPAPRPEAGLSLFRARQRLWERSAQPRSSSHTLGVPRALLAYTYLPFWRAFFSQLGVRTVLSQPTGPETEALASAHASPDYCQPMRLAHGHVAELAGRAEVDAVFLPHVVGAEPHDDGDARSVFCPFTIALGSLIRAAGLVGDKALVDPEVDLQWTAGQAAAKLSSSLGAWLGCSRAAIGRAWTAGHRAQGALTRQLEGLGQGVLSALEAEGGHALVVLGRSYTLHDPGANLGLPLKIAGLGQVVLPMDLLPLSEVEVPGRFDNVYWRHGRRMLQAAAFVAAHPQLHAVTLSSHGCGPDAFLATVVEHILGEAPTATLELDGQGGDAGYLTRVEALLDVIAVRRGQDGGPPREQPRPRAPAAIAEPGPQPDATLWIPPMHPYGAELLAAVLRRTGVQARPLPAETPEILALGRRFCRGGECLPAPAILGNFLEVALTSADPSRERLFLPSARGPCRFGQYQAHHRLALDQAGVGEAQVAAWSEEEAFSHDPRATRWLYDALVVSDLLYRARCRVRPHARDPDAFDARMSATVQAMAHTLEQGGCVCTELQSARSWLCSVPRTTHSRPLVGMVGELYLRVNPFTNGHLVEVIEESGGEAWVEPLAGWFQYLALLEGGRARREGRSMGARARIRLKRWWMARREHALAHILSPVIGDRPEPSLQRILAGGERVFPLAFEGEPIVTVGRALAFAEDGVDLVFNCAPLTCVSGKLTSDVFHRMEGELGVPVATLFCDGETDPGPQVRAHLTAVGWRRDRAG